ncbi:hypothetical protein [Aureivirga marina]|uniref:hypothetical protein n=1 Tax=Aureivirga marina TaxID=1182451 RepID=UPI0018C9989C|nr:hypothetical protein [Aureivirga marina]
MENKNVVTQEIINDEIINKINTIKLFLYKNYPSILEKLDFDNDDAFNEPLLFAFLRHKTINTYSEQEEEKILNEILQGYFKEVQKPEIDLIYTADNIAFIPNVGYFKKGEETQFLEITKCKNSSIEVLRCVSPVFKVIFDIPEEDQRWDDDLYNKNISYLNEAIQLIKEYSSEHFELIEKCCKYIYLFKTNPENSNSFSPANALGTVFFNIYQEGYNEVFFIDDIAHQTGHSIFNNLAFNPKAFYKINQDERVEDIIKEPDHRDINVLINALYTYYTTFLCLDNCIENNVFKDEKYEEAVGRIGFYIRKCYADLQVLHKVTAHFEGEENMYTPLGIDFIKMIKGMYLKMFEKWGELTNTFTYNNQDYNFSYEKFSEINEFPAVKN